MDKVPDVPDEAACREAVAQLFPGLCEEYLARIGNELGWVQDAVVNLILDQVEYPKQRTAKKRKADDAELDPAEEFGDPKKRFEGKNRRFQVDYGRAARDLLKHDFPEAYARHVDLVFSENYDCLYASYQELHSCFSKHAAAPDAKRYPRKQVPGNLAKQAREQLAELAQRQNEGTVQALKEYHAVRRSCALRDEEAENLAVAKAQRTTHECAICCEEVALNRTAHCPDGHVFCRGCVRNLASSQVSVGRHGLQCMALDAGCTAVFSHEQRALCLDAKLMMALDRLEAASALAAVEIENLASCPFCPYAEECPPVEEDSEFRCSGCAVVSCRKCKLETHLPNTCAEAAKERGISARHELEEAMTQAMMRKCNNCHIQFLKSSGCNRMKCAACNHSQCYVCSASISDNYDHFSATGPGACPLFDDFEQRHLDEVRRAEEATRARLLQEQPGVDAAELNIAMADAVAEDDQRRRAAAQPPPAVQVAEDGRLAQMYQDQDDLEALRQAQYHQGPPQPGLGPPQPGFGPPQPGFGPPQPGFGPPQPGFGPPQPGFGPPQPGFGPPQPGFGPPQPGFGPPHPGFGPPHPGFGPPHPHLGPPHPGQGPPHPGFGPPDAGLGPHPGPPDQLQPRGLDGPPDRFPAPHHHVALRPAEGHPGLYLQPEMHRREFPDQRVHAQRAQGEQEAEVVAGYMAERRAEFERAAEQQRQMARQAAQEAERAAEAHNIYRPQHQVMDMAPEHRMFPQFPPFFGPGLHAPPPLPHLAPPLPLPPPPPPPPAFWFNGIPPPPPRLLPLARPPPRGAPKHPRRHPGVN
ncbi:hypothetical protein P8C59_003002 [Phyllachora maydis]|uniref:RING-type domain-containing protein n=1 Tax=Phyllachora maydis TaxID=1825666 RepID=A0AAD9HZJ6_9PEZI|nr:hypothetical protein P8C59_003002 [Phyllachora maydis]